MAPSVSNRDIIAQKASKFHKKYLKEFITKVGLRSELPKFNKSPLFWRIMVTGVYSVELVQDDFEMPPYILKEIEGLFAWYRIHYFFKIPGSHIKLNIVETMEYLSRLKNAVKISFSERTKVYKRCMTVLETLNTKETQKIAFKMFQAGLGFATIATSSMDHWLYSYIEDAKFDEKRDLRIRLKVTITRKKAEVYKRTGKYPRRYHLFQISMMNGQYITKKITHKGEKCPIYFQPHALKRVEERTFIKKQNIHLALMMYVTYEDIRTYKTSTLIPFYSSDTRTLKIGYLFGVIFASLLLLNIFLFLSQVVTP